MSTERAAFVIDRRRFVALSLGTFVVASLPLALRRRRARLIRRQLPVMGTIAQFAVVDHDDAHANAAIDAAMDELRWVERAMTRFDDGSDVGRVNVGAKHGPVVVGAETALVVSEALRWAAATDGRYDPAVGAVVRAWDVTHRHEPPSERLVRPLAGRRLHRAVEVGEHRGAPVILFHDPAASIDLGSIAKGYGVDRAIARLRARGITSAIVEAGGDLYALGASPSGDPWRIGIQDPNDDRNVVGVVDVADAAVATSGTYRQFFRYRGKRFHHLMDPETAAPRETPVQSFTIRADSCMHADVAATALYGMPHAHAKALLARCAPGASIERIM
ncbi:MAG TPA: FAD:protein FMN transferase [Gemmatimonadaceae bacterium]|nr:FAD:protein FMN transferase [Gemmatimonadaceae bacterium]